jgi:chemotaxis protein CheZ
MEQPQQEAASDAAVVADLHNRIGQLTRQLHNSLHELGLADKLQGTAKELPDAKSRLTYIARLTGEAAEKVLNPVDLSKNVRDDLAKETSRITGLLKQNPVSAVATGQVLNYLLDVDKKSVALDQHLTDIMMAQDFHDLTGQVINRVVTLATTIETQLVELLLQTAPPEALAKQSATASTAAPSNSLEPGLQGPVINPDGNPEVVTEQSQVDDLLASLGF